MEEVSLHKLSSYNDMSSDLMAKVENIQFDCAN
jgi:hypothetical protein